MILNRRQLANIALRVATMGTRFGFVFVLAKCLDAGAVGYYGLFTAAVGYALLCVGLDFYIFTTREILNTPLAERGAMLKGHAALAGLLYMALLPVGWFFLSRAGWSGHLVWWFLPILLLEHLNQELSRLLVILSEQVRASVLLFVRQGSWAIVAVALMNFSPASRNLDTVMALWAISGAVAAALGIATLKHMGMGGWDRPVDWRWIRKGIAVSTTFLGATLSLRAIQTFDRYWLQDLAGIEVVGAYVLFCGVAAALSVFLDAAVFSFRYPELIAHHNNGDHARLRVTVRTTLAHTLGYCALFAVGSLASLHFLLIWIGKSAYLAQSHLYDWALAAAIAYAVGLVPHYGLYALGKDRAIIASHVVALPVFGVFTWGLSRVTPAMAVPVGVFAALMLILILKTLSYLKAVRALDRDERGPERLSVQF